MLRLCRTSNKAFNEKFPGFHISQGIFSFKWISLMVSPMFCDVCMAVNEWSSRFIELQNTFYGKKD